MAEEQAEVKEEKVEGVKIGRVTHYFTKLGVAIIELTDGDLSVGDEILVKGATSNFKQKADSMQIERDKVEKAEKGTSIGLKVAEHAREHDVVYKV